MRHTDSTLFRWTLGILCAAGLGGHGLRGACADPYRDSVATFYDNVLKHGRDHYGKTTPLFADGIDTGNRSAVISAKGEIISNFVFQQYLLRGLVGLSATGGDQKYRRAAHEATDHVLEHMVSPQSGLIYWGGHVYWDLEADTARFDPHNSHELKCDFPCYEFMYEVNPEATKAFIESFWEAHVDLEDEWMMFGRHARMDHAGPRGKVKLGSLAFINTGADLFYSAGFLFAKTGDPVWHDRAVGLAERFARLKHPRTGLAPAILDAYDPTFDRPTHKLSLGHLGVTVRNLLIPYGRRSDSFALCQLHLSEILSKDSADKFRSWALDDLRAYAKHCYDEQGQAFYEMRRIDTGERIKFSETRFIPTENQGHYFPPRRFRKSHGVPILFYAYAKGYKLTKDDLVKETARKCLDIMGIERGKDVTLSGIAHKELKSDSAACLIQGLLDLYEADADAWYLKAARAVADDALDRFFNGEFFADWPGEFRYSRVNQSLPLALLRLSVALGEKEVAIPPDIGGYGMEGFRPHQISFIDGDLTVRYTWAKHHIDIEGGNLRARVGDYFPHSGKVQDPFNYPGLWCLSSLHHPENVLDENKGMVFEPLWRVLPCSIIKLSNRQALIEHWQFRQWNGPIKRPYFGVRMDYRIEAPCYLDWTLEVTPLEENCGDLALRGLAHLNEQASPRAVFLGDSGFSTVRVGANEEIVVKPESKDDDEALRYRRPVFYSRIGDVALVFMFKPGAPVDLLAVGPSEKCPEPVRGFIWRIRSAEKGRAYKLDVRVGLLPVSSLGKVEQDYQRWSD